MAAKDPPPKPYEKDWWDHVCKVNQVPSALTTVPGPPCLKCVNWRPHITISQFGTADGIQLCIAQDMENDFSCFDKMDYATTEESSG